MLMVVDFPAPFGPSKPKTSPLLTEKLKLFTACFMHGSLLLHGDMDLLPT